MKRLITLVFIISACFFSMFMSIEYCGAETVFVLNGYDTVLSINGSNDGNFYILSVDNSKYKVTSIDRNFNIYETELDVETNGKSYAYTNGMFYFFGNEAEYVDGKIFKYVSIVQYDCREEVTQRRVINNAETIIDGTSAVDSSGRCYLKRDNAVDIYSAKYKILESIDCSSAPVNLTSSLDGSLVFAACGGEIKVISGDDCFDFNIDAKRIYANGGNYFSTNENICYRIDGSSLTECYSGFDFSHGNAVVDGWFFGVENSELIAVNDEEEISFGALSGEVYLCSGGEICGCFIKKGNEFEVRFLNGEDIREREEEMNSEEFCVSEENVTVADNSSENRTESIVSSTVSRTDNTGKNTSSAASSVDRETSSKIKNTDNATSIKAKSSDKDGTSSAAGNNSTASDCVFDRKNNVLSGIEPSMTIAQIRQKINVGSASVKFFDKNGYVKTSGNIGTGGSVKIDSTTFRIVIYGDLSGEGNVNSSDRKILAEELLGKIDLKDVYLKAGDVTGDDYVDLRDYVALDDYMKDNYSINQRR